MVNFLKKSLVFMISVTIVSTALVSIKKRPVYAGSNQESNTSRANIAKGSIAPDFTLENLNAEKVSLKDYRGSILILGIVFGDDAARDLQKYRRQLHSELEAKGITFLNVVQVETPAFVTKKFIRARMRKRLIKDVPDAPQSTLIDCGDTLDIGAQYGIKDRDTPAIFIIGRNGEILFSFQGWYSEENLSKLEKELSAILGVTSATQKKIIRIGVSRIMFHPALELAQKGFKTALEEAGYTEGKNIIFDHQDAQGDLDKMTRIAHKFVNDKVDMIHSLSILGTQLMVKVVKEIPVVFSMVTNPVEVGVLKSMEHSGTNVTGVSVHVCPLMDRWPVSSQLEMYVKFIPNAKRWGTVYNSGSVNTKFHITEISETSQLLRLELVKAPVSKADEIKKAAESLVGKVDAIYITSDKMAMSAFEDIAEVCNKNKIPLFGGELECVSRGAIAAYNQDYFLTGYKAGKKAVRILNGEKPGDIPSELTKKFYLVISPENARAQGLTIPEELKKKGDKIL